MRLEIKIPKMGESIAEATIGTIFKRAGSRVAMDEELLEIETEKVNQVLYAPRAGVVTYVVKQGDTVPVGAVIGHIDEEGKSEEKVNKAAPTPAAVLPEKKRETRTKMTAIRKVIAERMVQATQTTAMLTTFNEADMSALMEIREKEREAFEKKHGVKLGILSFFIQAVCSALEKFPELNSSIDGDEIVRREYYNIGIAVASERGLVVPVIRDAEKKSLAQLEKEISDYARMAREGGLTLEQLQGGGFTITNGGVFGSLLSTPILNPPQSGILGLHKIQKRAVVIEDQIQIRPMMYLALTYDHRIVDGKQAVLFLVHIKEAIENPKSFLTA